MENLFSFNLWHEPWITLEKPDGQMEVLGLEQALKRAHEFRAIYEPSPLVIVGIQRLLIAIVQDICKPQIPSDLRRLWLAGQFDDDKIAQFGATFAHRFDLFSKDEPFMQSADLPMKPDKASETVGYLVDEMPSGTAVTHFKHGSDEIKQLCPVCVAKGMLCVPAFASSGGRGIKPSINGVPPIYVFPIGKTLFESLCQCVLLPAFKPTIAEKENADTPIWKREPLIGRGIEITQVGYLHSLTFLARRIRLQPERVTQVCSRCGAHTEVVVKTMVYEMGESRPKEAAFWQDPFAAFRKQEAKPPIPVRPVVGKVLWRDFNALFLKEGSDTNKKKFLIRPSVLDQLDVEPWIDLFDLDHVQSLRCVGMRTNMKAKIFEWLDINFDVPLALLVDKNGGIQVGRAIECAEEGASYIFAIFKKEFNASAKNGERFEKLRQRMRDKYWAALAPSFRIFILALGAAPDRETELYRWVDVVCANALEAFENAAEQVGDDATSLRQRVQGELRCAAELKKLRKKYVPETEQEKTERETKKVKPKKNTRSNK
ncbi:MAG: type I-E CRISPR-associated protein Cse1/CasA [Anaerolineae bacterium]|nr:type I-E CRISPR-associated protein Cse1/CasA [Anaerolineae bacterium]